MFVPSKYLFPVFMYLNKIFCTVRLHHPVAHHPAAAHHHHPQAQAQAQAALHQAPAVLREYSAYSAITTSI
jgi:hypothetical protein